MRFSLASVFGRESCHEQEEVQLTVVEQVDHEGVAIAGDQIDETTSLEQVASWIAEVAHVAETGVADYKDIQHNTDVGAIAFL